MPTAMNEEHAVELVELRKVVGEELRDTETQQGKPAVAELTHVSDEADDYRDQPENAPENAEHDLRRLRALDLPSLDDVDEEERGGVDVRHGGNPDEKHLEVVTLDEGH